MEEKRGLTIKDILIRLVLIIIFIFLLIWLFPMPDLKPLNNQIFADNIDRMKEVAKSYYTLERLPKDINSSKKMTLKEMIDNKYILPLMDSNGNYCSEEDSYVEITKLENEYLIKVYLSCTDKQDYIIEHYGCYDFCNDECLIDTTVATTSAKEVVNNTTKKTKKITTKATTKYTTKKTDTIYEYQFVRNECTEKFDKYVCPSDYYLTGDTCIKNGSKVIQTEAKKEITDVISTDTKPAKPVTSSSTELVDASCRTDYKTSTIDAGYKKTTYKANESTVTQKVTANKVNSYDVKGAVKTTKRKDVSYIEVQNYDVINADKVYQGYKWVYESTLTTDEPNLQYVGENEKLELVDSWKELTCDTCTTTRTVYKYWKFKKVANGEPTYSCDAYPGYSLYDGNKCRKATNVTKTCPSGYDENGNVCSKWYDEYSCSKYGSDYKLDESKKTCTKTTTTYNCDGIGQTTSDPKYCSKVTKEYTCPSYMEKQGTGASTVCIDKHDYYCPSDTSTKTYTLNGTKCTVKTKVKVCSCPSGSVQTEDKLHCAITNSDTKYTCEDYPGYTLNGDKCTKTEITQKETYSCDEGYTLNGTTCFKTVNVTESKKAEKTYKTYCENKYIWSTQTSLDGWSYTGNKRPYNG